MPIVESILAQHADEAAFLWLLRDRAVRQPHYKLADLLKLDVRIEAHIDGLCVDSDAGWDICARSLDNQPDAGEIFAAAVIAFGDGGSLDRIHRVLETGTKSYELSRGLASALGWLPSERVEPQFLRLLQAQSCAERRVGIAACAAHRRDPGGALADALTAGDPMLRSRALRSIGEIGLKEKQPAAIEALDDPDLKCRVSAAWSCALLSDEPRAVDVLLSAAVSDPDRVWAFLPVAMRRLSVPQRNAWHSEMSKNAVHARLAIIGAGILGDPANIPWLLEQMKSVEFARVAGEAFSMITGADLSLQSLDGAPPEGFQSGPTDEPGDENVDLDPDENLPWPDAGKLSDWWSHVRSQFQDGLRFFLGAPVSVESSRAALRRAFQRQRTVAALEISIAIGDALFEVRAPGFRQRDLLDANSA
jgi:uncharacterized protein (TIGR02270 family)